MYIYISVINGAHTMRERETMNILIVCEESQSVLENMRKQGHNAYSCDLYSSSHDDVSLHRYHLKGDLFYHFDNPPKSVSKWGMVIAFPPCTYLTVSGNRWMHDKTRFPNRQKDRLDALNFVKRIWSLDCPRIAIENPVGVLSTQWMRPTQYVQPYEYGHTISKKTCLWLKGLNPLEPTDIQECDKEKSKAWYTSALNEKTSEARRKARSKTFQGIAEAMASQWS